MQRLAGKVALVTGAGGGVGLGIAQAFAREGASLVITGRDEQPLAAAVRAIEQRGGRVAACPGDASQRDNARRAVAAAMECFGALDVLVSNAQAGHRCGCGVPGERREPIRDRPDHLDGGQLML